MGPIKPHTRKRFSSLLTTQPQPTVVKLPAAPQSRFFRRSRSGPKHTNDSTKKASKKLWEQMVFCDVFVMYFRCYVWFLVLSLLPTIDWLRKVDKQKTAALRLFSPRPFPRHATDAFAPTHRCPQEARKPKSLLKTKHEKEGNRVLCFNKSFQKKLKQNNFTNDSKKIHPASQKTPLKSSCFWSVEAKFKRLS